jgi:hypothetical protein
METKASNESRQRLRQSPTCFLLSSTSAAMFSLELPENASRL